jgi:hypothetical protein
MAPRTSAPKQRSSDRDKKHNPGSRYAVLEINIRNALSLHCSVQSSAELGQRLKLSEPDTEAADKSSRLQEVCATEG